MLKVIIQTVFITLLKELIKEIPATTSVLKGPEAGSYVKFK